jgi:methionyl-tRNA synthetase
MPQTAKKFFLTTPIYYVNARPHIGHAYTTIAADVIARRHRLLGDDTFFLTGTDEHGQKVQRSAAAAGIPPQQFADQVSASFQDLWKRMGITNDDYIRTTEARHHRGVQHLWRELEARGAIYLSSYTGAYCVSDEAFADVPVGAPCPICGRPTETITEENYFFRLSDYQLPLLDLIESGALHIQPETARNEVLSFLRGGLKDLSISRTSFTWGIPVPGNPKHVVYVWLDALANYITAIGYGAEDRDDLTAEQKHAEQEKFKRYWPADLHLVGKEITRFHCVYWPAILLALNPKLQHGPNEPGAPRLDSETWVSDRPQLTPVEHAEWAKKMLPKSIVANGWLLFEESKMSKSRGNVVRTETILDAFGPLCPPVALEPSPESVIPSDPERAKRVEGESRDPRISSVAPAPSGGSRGLQPPEQTPLEGGALAPGLAPPSKAQQDLFAADVLRYFLLREIPFGQDGTFSFDALITRYNADLANGYGNLVSRTLAMIHKYFGGIIPATQGIDPFKLFPVGEDTDFVWITSQKANEVTISTRTYDAAIEVFDFYYLLSNVLGSVGKCDQYVTAAAPWKVNATDEPGRLEAILYSVADAIRILTAQLYPFMPYATASVWRQLGLGDIEEAARSGELKDLKWGGLEPGTKLGPLAPIFPRADKGLAQLMTEMENPSTPTTPEPATAPAPEKSVASVASVLSSSPAATTEAAAAATPGTSNLEPRTSDLISIDDFAKVDLRVAQIVVAERVPKTDKLLRLEVDLGPSFNPSRRQILAGIAEHYAPEALIGRKVVIVANLAPRKMRGLESQGMVVAASVGPAGAPVLTGFLEDVEIGARLK